MTKLAIYDMDRTITHAPTWTAFLIETARRQAPWRLALLPLAAAATAAYGVKAIDRGQLKQMTQRVLLGHRMRDADAKRAAEHFAGRIAGSGVFAGARAQIAADRAAGYRLVMATASYRFYASAIADRLGFDDVIATEVERIDDRLRARISGENCYGPGKLRMIEAWMTANGIKRADAQIRFYSDHVSDAPVLEWADEGFAVNAHGPLRQLARERGWPIVDWER
ncbi:MAG: HAD-IB family hydrolase [Sphingomonas bacterium]